VAKDVVDAILKTRARSEGRCREPATYWDAEKQEEFLKAAFKKWAERGNVWSAAAEKVRTDRAKT
jgi:hypothetical protein